MAKATKIEWCDRTHNEWFGCNGISPACDHCYAEAWATRYGKNFEKRTLTSVENRRKPLRWNAQPFVQCASCGWRGEFRDFKQTDGTGFDHEMCPECSSVDYIDTRCRVFSASLSDWLDNKAPIEWLVGHLNTVRLTPNLYWLLLSKRIGNWNGRLTAAHQHVVKTMGGGTSEYRDHPLWALSLWIQDWLAGKAPANVWIGATICNQAEADRDIPKLLRVPAAVRFLSIEPMLSAINFRWRPYAHQATGETYREYLDRVGIVNEYESLKGIDWIIDGGESGANARPSNPQCFRGNRDQCAEAGVSYFHKQNGEWVSVSEVEGPGKHFTFPDGQAVRRVGKKLAGRTLDGVIHNQFPAVRNG